jgi:hypothetical protein
MKTQITRIISTLAFCASLHQAAAQGTAFTYQGRLNTDGSPANGSYDFVFYLYNATSGGSVISGGSAWPGVGVTNGLFTVTLDFGSGIFTGQSCWLDIAVRTNSAVSYVELSPRQQLTPTPYAIYAENSGGVNNSSISAPQLNTAGAPANGQVLEFNGTSLVWANPASGGSGWSLTGNAGTIPGTDFLGTTDNEPLEFWVNGTRALRLEPGFGSPNVVGGVGSSVDPYVSGATIAGGVYNTVSANSDKPTIGGGNGNTVSNLYPTISGGEYNKATANGAAVGGGYHNLASGRQSAVGGGAQNIASGAGAVIGGGGYDGTNQPGNNAGGAASVVAGGMGNNAPGNYATIAGGNQNYASGAGGFVGGGGYDGTTVAGNGAGGAASVVGGGLQNGAFGMYDTVPGGDYNTASGGHSFAAGHQAQALHLGSFVWADAIGGGFQSTAIDQFSVRAYGGVRFVTGGNGTTGMTLDGYQVLTTATGGGGGGFTNGWSLSGNGGTTPGVNFLGTTDGAELVFKAHNKEGLRLTPNQDLILQRPSDFSDFSERNGLGVYGFTSALDTGSRIFANQNVSGPVLYGEAGGGLGVISATSLQTLALYWSTFGVYVNLPTTFFANTTIDGAATVNGNATITGNESFGAQTRQMIDLYNSGPIDYGIGVQP